MHRLANNLDIVLAPLGRIIWFFSSYAPLWLLLAIRFDSWRLRSVLIALALGSFFGLWWLLVRRERSWSSPNTVRIAGEEGEAISGYLAAYLLPFLTVSEPDLRELLAYSIFIAVTGVVYLRSNLFQVNPTIYLLRRRVLRGTIDFTKYEKTVFVVTKRDPHLDETFSGERFSDRVYIDHADTNKQPDRSTRTGSIRLTPGARSE